MYINHSVQKKQYFVVITFLILSVFIGHTQSHAQDTTWTFHPLPFQQGMLNDLSFVDDAIGWAVGRDENAGTSVIVNTVDSGAVWILQNHPLQDALYGVYFMDADTGYAVGQANYGWVVVLKTTNGGITWQVQTVPPVHGFLQKVTFTDQTHGWAVGNSLDANATLILHTENGADWVQVNHPARSGILYNVYFTDENNGWTVGADDFGGGAPIIFHTEDGGDNWEEQIHGFDHGGFSDVFFISPDTGFVTGGVDTSGVMLRTENGGEIWAPVAISGLTEGPTQTGKMANSFTEYVIRIDRIDFVGLFGVALLNIERNGSNEVKVLITQDGGLNWFPWGDPLKDGTAKGLGLNDERVVQVVGRKSDGRAFSGTATVHVNPPELTRIDVTPSEVTLNVNEQQQFQARGYDAQGNEVPITPGWSACGGTITTGGLYTATTAGDFIVTASVQGSTVTGTASVHVNPPELTRIDVTPSEVTLNVNEQQQFQARGYDAQGNEVPITPGWSACGGTITIGGLYTATTAGDFTVTASVQGSTVTGTASVHVNPPELTRIDVTPSEVTLNVNEQQQFQARGYDAQGNEVPITPGWSACGGTITTGGDNLMKTMLGDSVTALYTALETGDHIVVCTDSTSGIADTAQVHVISTGVLAIGGLLDEFELFQNIPNPFNPETTIHFNVKITCHVSLKVVDLIGREIAVLANSQFTPGMHEVKFDGQELPSGLYFYIIRMKGFYDIKKMMILE